jgi:tetratricopeptide (TPR) repeat protein
VRQLSTAHFDALLHRLSGVTSRRTSVALGVWGEPGVGKTHLVHALLRELSCRSLSVHATAPDLTLLRMLPRPERLPVWAEQTLAKLERGGSVEAKPVTDLLAAWLAALAPFVLHIEDLHEASPPRAAMLRALASAVTRGRGGALIVTGRLEPEAPFEAQRLLPLTTADAAKLLEGAAGSRLPADALEWIAGRSRGNPLFTLEYFRHLTRLGHLWTDGYRWRWRAPQGDNLPVSVEAVIAHHLRASVVTSQARAALAARAVLPREASDLLWATVAALTPTELREARLELERGNVLRDGAFTHPLYRETARADLNRAQRRDLARRAVDALTREQPVEAARFITEAELPPDVERALLERAATQAQAMGDVASTATLLARSAAFDDEPVRTKRLLEASRVAREVNLALALELAQTAFAANPESLEARLLTAELLAALGRGDDAHGLLDSIPDDQGARYAELVFDAHVRVRHFSHDYAGVLELWADRASGSGEHPSAATTAMIARAMVQINRLEDAEALLASALSVSKLERLELAELLYIRAFVPNFAGQYAAAEVGFSAFLHTIDALGDGALRFREMRAGALQLRAYIRNVLGRPAQAAEDIRQALHFHAEVGDAGHYAQLQSELGLYLMESGEYAAAEDALLESRGVLEFIDNPIYLSMLERIEARFHLEDDAPHSSTLALKHARASLEQIERAGRPPAFTVGALFVNAWAEALHGDLETALLLAAQLENLGAQPGNRAGAAWVRGLVFDRLNDIDEARRWLLEAVTVGTPMRLGPTLQRMSLELDRLNRDEAAARERARLFQTNGALSALRIAGRYFPAAPNLLEPSPTSHLVRLEVLGAWRVVTGGVALTRQGKARELLDVLLETRIGGQSGRADLDLYDALYPDWVEPKAASALKQLVYRLRLTLGAHAIARVGNGYALGDAVRSDAEEFLRTADTKLWRAPFGVDLEVRSPSNLGDVLHHALRERARTLEGEDPTEAERIRAILLEMENIHFESHGLLIPEDAADGVRTP